MFRRVEGPKWVAKSPSRGSTTATLYRARLFADIAERRDNEVIADMLVVVFIDCDVVEPAIPLHPPYDPPPVDIGQTHPAFLSEAFIL